MRPRGLGGRRREEGVREKIVKGTMIFKKEIKVKHVLRCGQLAVFVGGLGIVNPCRQRAKVRNASAHRYASPGHDNNLPAPITANVVGNSVKIEAFQTPTVCHAVQPLQEAHQGTLRPTITNGRRYELALGQRCV